MLSSRFPLGLALAAALMSSVSAYAAETTRTVVNTAYADPDNDPPGSDAIAFPKSDGYPTVHNGTGGTGTFADPITIASDPRDFPAGTRIYVPSMLFYGMVEDTCANCIADRSAGRPTKIDFFAGGKGQSYDTMAQYESSITSSSRQIIVNPNPGKNIIVGPLWDTRRKTSGNGTGTPDTSTGGGGGGGGTGETTSQVQSFGYGWVTNGGNANIAYAGPAPRHACAQGNGTYTNPVSVAISDALKATYPVGSIIYIDKVVDGSGVTHEVDHYGVIEDQSSGKFGIWVGGSTNSCLRNTVTGSQLTAAEAKVTGTATIVKNPAQGKPVLQGQIALTVN